MNQNRISPSKFDRKSIEKNRRNQLKALYCKLCSLLPRQSSKEIGNMSDELGEAASYIKKLQERLEAMKRKRDFLKVRKSENLKSNESDGGSEGPVVQVDGNGSTLKVVLMSGIQEQCMCMCMLKETLRILMEEGADVVSAAFSVLDRTVIHTVYSQIGGSGLENEGARISERLRKFVADEY
ncbi:transcription factor bHLH162-like [Salvia miltiorrhiza]|uniref:transcription factor bHLH162-like n=1 Tax=Salvia miltiorrhiza TaxID=226208 RepID=UPI0025ABFA1D|nr:transcription factor bHLH162-like [Salvia miltiorrhiza]